MVRVLRRYSDAFKRSVVAEVESGRYTVLEAAAAHQVNFSSVYNWIKKMGSPDTQTRIMRIEMPDERKRIKELEKEKRALESCRSSGCNHSIHLHLQQHQAPFKSRDDSPLPETCSLIKTVNFFRDDTLLGHFAFLIGFDVVYQQTYSSSLGECQCHF